jgi:stalled ribosome alternative rescue factor ArfA
MSEDFERHKDKRISEMRERIRNNKLKKKVEMKTFGQRVEKAWKNIDQIKSN